jgi:hypothetical protein
LSTVLQCPEYTADETQSVAVVKEWPGTWARGLEDCGVTVTFDYEGISSMNIRATANVWNRARYCNFSVELKGQERGGGQV